MKRFCVLFAMICVLVMITGCTGQLKTDEQTTTPTTDDAVTTSTTPKETATEPTPAQTVPIIIKGSLTDCSFLSLNDVKSAVGIDMKEAGLYPRANGCSKSWIDLRTSMDASVALQVTKQEQSATQQDLTMAAGTFGEIDKIGDYDTSWDENGDAVNFGKGDYKFQVQCIGDSCTKEKALAMADIVISKTS